MREHTEFNRKLEQASQQIRDLIFEAVNLGLDPDDIGGEFETTISDALDELEELESE